VKRAEVSKRAQASEANSETGGTEVNTTNSRQLPIYQRSKPANGEQQAKPKPAAPKAAAPAAPAPAPPQGPDSHVQNQQLRIWARERTKVKITSSNGEVLRGIITAHDSFTVMLQAEIGKNCMVLKHSIWTITAD
jgi:RNA chaperone Hfq